MRKNPHHPRRIVRRQLWLIALAALALAGCSSSAGSTEVRTAPVTPALATSTPTPAVAPAPTVTVTVTPEPIVQTAASGPVRFQSPSGNINYTLSAPGGNEARCEVVDHTWAAPPPSADCHLNWGDRFYVTQGSAAGFGCYGQEFPTAEQTLGYGQALSLGTITCDSESSGMTCTDSSTGHYFRISRESYELG